jgi:hypothetical protein
MAMNPIPFAEGRSSYTEIFLRIELESSLFSTFKASFMVCELEVAKSLQGHIQDRLVDCEIKVLVVDGSLLLETVVGV